MDPLNDIAGLATIPFSYFVGLAFAWVVMGMCFILPWGAAIESMTAKWVDYATDSDVELKRVLRKWNRSLDRTLDTGYGASIIMYHISALFVVITRQTRHETSFPDDLIFSMFGMYVPVGSYLAPGLIVAGAAYGVTVLSRGEFKFKQKVEEKLDDGK